MFTKLESEPTTYEDDIQNIEDDILISQEEINRIKNTYLVDLSMILFINILLIFW